MVWDGQCLACPAYLTWRACFMYMGWTSSPYSCAVAGCYCVSMALGKENMRRLVSSACFRPEFRKGMSSFLGLSSRLTSHSIKNHDKCLAIYI